ncbi:MAG TPA: lipopolysaccharide biosynthesis protein [Candidatus Limnocylindria bacterium]|jgi:PST family polysaccharide transporter
MSEPIEGDPGSPPDAPEPDSRDARRRFRQDVATGLTWTLIGTWGRQGIDLVVFAVLARLLLPEDFGLVALAMVFVLFAQLLVDQGMGDALVQRREITPLQIDTAFWVAVATGGLLTVALFLLAWPIAALLGEPELQPILQVLSLTFVLAAFTTIQIALLRRDLAFRSLSLRALAASAGGGVVGVIAALAGWGVWALVAQQVAATIFSVLTLWWVTSWRPSWNASRAEFGSLFRFGIHIVGGDVITYMTRNVDNLLVGAVIGPVALGFYVVGYRILTATQAVLVQITRKMTFPVFSRLQDDPERMVRTYNRVTAAAATVILPGYIAAAIVAPELIVVLFGGRWDQSGPVARVLLLIGPVVAIQALSLAMLNAVGRPDVAFRFRLVTTILTVGGFLVAVQSHQIVAVAAAYVIPAYLLLPLNLLWMQRYAGIGIGAYLARLRGVAAATVVMALVMIGGRYLLGEREPWVLLVALLGIGAITFVGALWVFDRGLMRDVLGFARQAIPRRRRPPPGSG